MKYGVDLELPNDKLFGLLVPNRAGKLPYQYTAYSNY